MPTSLTDQMFAAESGSEKESLSLTDQMFSKQSKSLTDQMFDVEEAKPGPKYSFEPTEASNPYLQSTNASTEKYGLPENLLNNLINTESGFNSDASNPSGATGIAQIVPKWHPGVDATDAEASIDYAGGLLKKHYDKFGDWDSALAAYNAGPSRVAKGMDKLPEETRNYLGKINKFRIKQGKEPITDVGGVGEVVDKFKPAGEETIQGKLMTEMLESSVQEYDELKTNPILTEQFKSEFVDTLKGYASLATQPIEVVRGGAEFALSLPGFGLGIVGAAQKMLERMGRPFTLNDLYDAASEGMEELQTYWGEKMVEPLLGKPSVSSQLVGQTAMAPAIGLSTLGHEVASRFEGYPNVQGLAKFSGDIGGLVALGRIYRGSNAEVTAKAEKVVRKAEGVVTKEKLLDQTLDESLRAAQEEVIKVEKIQLELEAAEVQKNLDYPKMVKEDLSSKTKRTKKIKHKQSEIPDVQVNKAMEGIKEPSIIETHYGTKEEILAEGKEKARLNEINELYEIEHIEGVLGGINSVGDPMAGLVSRYGADRGSRIHKAIYDLVDKNGNFPKAIRAKEVLENADRLKIEQTKPEPVTELDIQSGIEREPIELSTHKHPFRQTIEETEAKTELFERYEKSGELNDPRLYTSYLINKVNGWLDGKPIPIEKVRDSISELATRSEEVRREFVTEGDYPGNFLDWKESVDSAAKWARKADRKIIKRTNEPSIDLNMMIPLDKVPSAVKGIAKKISKGFKDTAYGSIFRNKEIWKKTGYWLDKDGNWRYEIPDYINIYDKNNKVRVDWKKLYNGKITDLASILKHDKLYKDVPGLRSTKITVNPGESSAGYYSPLSDTIVLRHSHDLETFWHEIQHAVEEKANTKFKGSSVRLEGDKKVELFTDELIAAAKNPKVKEMVEVFKDDYFRNANKPFAEPTYTLGDIYKEAKKNPDDYWALQELDQRILGEDPYVSYLKDPGEMLARLESKRAGMGDVQRSREAPWETLDEMLGYEGLAKEKGDWYSSDPGTKLFDITSVPTEGAKALIAGAKKLSNYTKQARGMKKFKPVAAAKMLKEEFNRSFIDRSGNIRTGLLDKLGNVGYDVVQKMYLAKGASSLAANNLKQMGKEVYSGLSKNEKRVLDNLILADRMLDIGKYKTTKQFKFPEGLEPTNSAAYNELFQHIEKIDARTAADLKRRAGAYFEWMKKPLKDMLDNGLISEKEYNNLSSHNYRRIKLVDVFDKRYQAKVGKKQRTVYDSGIESLSKGRDTDVFEPSSEIMALEVFNRSYGRILNNKANQSLFELAKSQPENEFVRVKEKKGDKIPSGWNRTFVYEDGVRKPMYLSPEMSKEWITSNPEMSYKASQMLRYASMSPVLRTFATGINWGFALANLPRDIQHTWFTARAFEDGKWKPIYNPNMSVFAAQIGRDMVSVFSDALMRKGRYEKYIEGGGGMEFLVHQGRLMQRGRHVEGSVDKVYNFLGYFGETSEIMTRLAIRERALRKGKSRQEATFIARDYMDFGQGGGIAKAADNAVPYLNATIQGTRGLLRSFKPGSGSALSSTYKLTQYAALVSGLYIAMNKMHPESSKALKGNMDMQNNLVLPLGDNFGFEDSNGQMRYPYLKIPIDPGQKFFKTFFEAASDKWLGNEVDVNRVVDSLKELSPASVTELPPSISGVLGYVTNKDFWLNEDIWRKTDKPFNFPRSKEEFIPGKTPQAYIDFGASTGLSPERTKFAVEELVTNGTVWSYLLGQGYDAMFGDLPKSKKEMHLAEVLSKIPVIKRFFGTTNPYSQFAKPIDKAKESSELKRWIQNRGLDAKVNGYLVDKTVTRKEVAEYMKGFKDKDVFDRLKDRFEFSEKIKDLPNRSFWLRMKSLNVDARAEVYVKRLELSSEEERKQLNKELHQIILIGGVVSKGFMREVSRIKQDR